MTRKLRGQIKFGGTILLMGTQVAARGVGSFSILLIFIQEW